MAKPTKASAADVAALANALGWPQPQLTFTETLEQLAESPPLEAIRHDLSAAFGRWLARLVIERKEAKGKTAAKIGTKTVEVATALEAINTDEWGSTVADCWRRRVELAKANPAQFYAEMTAAVESGNNPIGHFMAASMAPDEVLRRSIAAYVADQLTIDVGGRRRSRDELADLIEKMPDASDKAIAAKYNQRYARSINNQNKNRASATIVKNLRYERKHRTK